VRLLLQIVNSDNLPVNLPELTKAINAIPGTDTYRELKRKVL
jgi:hypothetical protein